MCNHYHCSVPWINIASVHRSSFWQHRFVVSSSSNNPDKITPISCQRCSVSAHNHLLDLHGKCVGTSRAKPPETATIRSLIVRAWYVSEIWWLGVGGRRWSPFFVNRAFLCLRHACINSEKVHFRRILSTHPRTVLPIWPKIEASATCLKSNACVALLARACLPMSNSY